jgi:NAD(P)-dependent dehydrogenase (short-subunit alcohol dehydrogenase family)
MALFGGKVALVTGGGSGIGRATAIAFARAGAKVVVAGRRAKEGEETVSLVRESGGEGLFVRTDVSREADVRAMVAHAVEAFGRLDYAFNNAGVEQNIGPLAGQTEEAFDEVMSTNVKGVWLSMKYEIPQMPKHGGAVVNNASVAGVVGFPGAPLYSASKHAVVGLTRSVALEYARLGVRVNAVCPGVVETEMVGRVFGGDDSLREHMMAMHPMHRFGTPEEVAEASSTSVPAGRGSSRDTRWCSTAATSLRKGDEAHGKPIHEALPRGGRRFRAEVLRRHPAGAGRRPRAQGGDAPPLGRRLTAPRGLREDR